MSRLLKTLSLLIVLTLVSEGQPDTCDTLYTRSNKMILVPRYDSIKELKKINAKADTIMADLKLIKTKLGINETDTLKHD